MVPSSNDEDIKGSGESDTGDGGDGDGDGSEALHDNGAWVAMDADAANPWPMESAH